MHKITLSLPIISGCCWGSSGVFVRILTSAGFDSITLTFFRILVTVILMALVMLIRDPGLFRIRRKDLPLTIIIGIVGYFFMNMSFNISVNVLSLSLASILLCTAPVFVIIFGSILFGERITPVRIICMLGVLLGCVLLSGIVESGGLKWSVFGLLMGAATSLCNATYTLTANEAVDRRGIHPLTLQFYASLFAMIPMLPFAGYHNFVSFIAADPLYGSAVFLANAVLVSMLPNLLYSISLRHIDSGVASVLASGAEPTSALLFGLFIYQEIPTAPGLLGMVIVILSLIILTRSDADSGE